MILLTFGCATDESLGETTQFAKLNPGFGDEGCPDWGCGSNSPVIKAFVFWELNELERWNAQDFRITDFRKYSGGAWRHYRADVLNGQLMARNGLGDVVFFGAGVQNAIFDIEHTDGTRYELRVAEVERMAFWAPPANPGIAAPQAFTYRLRWKQVYPPVTPGTTNVEQDLCGESIESDAMHDFHAVLFDDDRISAANIEVTGETANWFNIGCKSHALAKQHLLGHTKAANTILGFTTTLAQRTANLKMLSGDYCGNGAPMTVAGQKLRFHDKNTNYDTITGYNLGAIEAKWTEDGATCLNTPRVDWHSTTLADQTFPNGIEAEITEWCTPEIPRPPPCNASRTDYQGAEIISLNPSFIVLPPNWP